MKTSFLIIIQLYFITVFSRITEISHEFPYDMTLSDVNGWTHVNNTLTRLVECDGHTVFGEFGGLNPWAEKTYTNLPPHFSASVTYENLDIRSFDSESTNLIVDDVLRTKSYFADYYAWKTYSKPCTGGNGQSWKGLLYPRAMSVNFTHTGSTMKVRFQSTINSGAYDESFGISNLYIHVDECHQSCLTCDGPTEYDCLTCPQNSVQGSSNDCYCESPNFASNHQCSSPTCPTGYIQNHSTLACELQCSDNCSTCTSKQSCTQCNPGFYKLNGYCVSNCPFYTSLNSDTCVDTTYNSIAYPYVLVQDMSNVDFSSPELQKKGWTPGQWEIQTHDSVAYRFTNMATEICNGLQLALGWQFNREYVCNPSCSFSNSYTDLPPHYAYNLKAQVWMGDNWQGELMKIVVDGATVHTQAHTLVSGTRDFNCGVNSAQASSDYIYEISLTNIAHSASTLSLSFQWTQTQIAMLAWLGLRDVQVVLQQCDPKCASCSNSTSCDTCNPTRQNAPNCNDPATNYFDDGSNSPYFVKCSYQCLECSGSPDNCTKCRFYVDSSKLPTCGKPDSCLKYASVKSVGYNQIESQGATKFVVEGTTIVETRSRGITIVRLDYDGNYVSHKTFDTHQNENACADLATYVADITLSHVTLLGIYDSGTDLITSTCSGALRQLGWNSNLNIGKRDSYALLSRKKHSWYYPHDEDHVDGQITTYSAYAEECIVKCAYQCAECSGTPSNCTKCKYFTATPAPTCGIPTNCLTFVEVWSNGLENNNLFRAKINGSIPSGQTNSRGMNIVELDELGTVYTQTRYDTYGSNQAVLDLQDKIDSLPNGRYLLMGVNDEGSNQFNNGANQGYEKLETIGYDRTQVFGSRDGFSIIGKKGASVDQVLQQVGHRHDTGKTYISQCLKECDFKCGTCSTSSSNCDTCSSNLRDSSCNLPTNCGKFVYLKSVGNLYSKWHASAKEIKFYINDIDATFSQASGIHILVLDSQGQIDSTQSYDYSSDSAQLSAMITFINNIDSGNKVLIISKDDMSVNMTSAGYTALQSLGLSNSVTLSQNEAFVMLGEKGATQGSATYFIGENHPGAVELQACAMGCQYQCGTCQMETYTCLSCSDATRIATPDCNCKDGTFDVGIPKCSDCDYKCATCNTNKDNCLTCSDTNRDINNSCLCKDSWYNDGTNPTCQKCPNKYAKCNSATDGTQCQGTNRSTITPACACNDGYYDDNTNSANCVQCDSSCTKCSSNTVCSECAHGYFLSGTSCLQCPNKYAKCTSATVGTQCQGTNRSVITPACACNDGYYDDNTNSANCVQCDTSCSKCSSNTVCSECNNGYYKSGNSCPQCLNKFARCSDATTGLECQGNNRSSDFSNGCLCNSNYFDDGTNKADCTQCDSNCKECQQTSTKCTECYHGFFLDNDKCTQCPSKFAKCTSLTAGTECQGNNRSLVTPNCLCNTGYYDDNVNANCVQCPTGCKECSSASNCSSCNDQYYLDGQSCNQCPNKYAKCSDNTTAIQCQGQNRSTDHTTDCLCNSGYFDDGSNKADCDQCAFPCKLCEDNANKCLSCIDSYYLTTNTCNQCPVRYTKCSSSTVGDECAAGVQRTLQTPDCGCEQGYFDNNVADCQICQSPCSECVTSDSNCTKCIDGYYLDGNTCKQCDLTKCQTCENNPTECIICANSTRGGETCDCLSGYFEEGVAQCGVCDYQCESCSGSSSSCDTCSDSNRDQNNNCQCKDTFYDDGVAECKQCQYPCLNCSSQNICLSCSGLNRSQPKCTCIHGYYEKDGQPDCEQCNIQCQSCIQNQSNCLTCQRGKFRTMENPTCGCRDGTFEVEGQIDCQQCFSGCKTCTSYNVCTECNNKNFGLPECIKSKYESGQTFSLEVVQDDNSLEVVQGQCEFQCLTCQSHASNCTVCKVGLNRIQEIPSCLCIQGYHDNNQTSDDCFQCQNNCKTCTDNATCLSCYEGKNRELNPITMKCDCQIGFTQDKSNPEQCLPCYFYRGQCFLQCPQNTIQDDQLKSCSDIVITQNSNTVLIFLCLSVFIVFQIALFGIIRYQSNRKVQNLYKKDLQQVSNKENSSEEDNRSKDKEVSV